MKKTVVIMALLWVNTFAVNVVAEEISLYDFNGDAVAYIDTTDDMTIYLWDGDPVGYLSEGSFWGFNGNHLGWYKKGIVWDHHGYAVGFIKGSINKTINIESIKGIKSIVPIKSIQEIEPIEPILQDKWSKLPLSLHLKNGK